jgi:hypothetical protein
LSYGAADGIMRTKIMSPVVKEGVIRFRHLCCPERVVPAGIAQQLHKRRPRHIGGRRRLRRIGPESCGNVIIEGRKRSEVALSISH